MSHHHRGPIDDLKHTVNRDALLAALYLGNKLDHIRQLEEEQTHLARLQWWNSLTPAQQQAELEKAEAESARQERVRKAQADKAEEMTMRKAGYSAYWFSRIGWFLLLVVASWAAAGISWGPETKRPWIFILYLAAAVLVFFGPLKQRARRIRAEHDRKYQMHYGEPVRNATGVHNSRPNRDVQRTGTRGGMAVEPARPKDSSVERDLEWVRTLMRSDLPSGTLPDPATGGRTDSPGETPAVELADSSAGLEHRLSLPATEEDWRATQRCLEAIQARWKWDAHDLPDAAKALVPCVLGSDFSALSPQEIAAIRHFLAGVDKYDRATRDSIAQSLAANVNSKIRELPPGLTPAFTLIAVAVFAPDPPDRSQALDTLEAVSPEEQSEAQHEDVEPSLPSIPSLFHIRCPECSARNDVPSLPSVCYRCRAALEEEGNPADFDGETGALNEDEELDELREKQAEAKVEVASGVEEMLQILDHVDPARLAPEEKAAAARLLDQFARLTELLPPDMELSRRERRLRDWLDRLSDDPT